ncbi:MAG: hypothetical protein ABI700_08270 [Chloroflexota bacterium]
MFELSDAEVYVLKELWKLIQTKRTAQGMPLDDVTNATSLTMQRRLDDPLIEDRMGVLHYRWTGRT